MSLEMGEESMDAKIIEGQTASKVQGEMNDWLKTITKTVRFVSQSQSQHGRDEMSHHISVIVWYD